MTNETGQEPSEGEIATDLVRRIRAGEVNAEAELIELYSRGVLYLLRRLGVSQEVAPDLHQEAFRIALERLRGRGLAEPAGFVGFLHGTVRNLALAEQRKSARRRTDLDDKEVSRAAHPAPSQLQQALRKEESALVRHLIGELATDRDRQLLVRYYIAEEDKEQICADLGLDGVHFHRVLFRARQRFKELLERFERGQRPPVAGRTR